jgi:UDPglucose 6-dehydrogenase
VGLVTGAGLASTGNHVTLADPLQDRIEILKSGGVPFFEPNLPELLASARRSKNIDFIFTSSPQLLTALEAAEVYFITVGTPEKEDGTANLEYVMSAVDMMSQQKGDLSEKIVVTKSTVPVGTGDLIEERFKLNGKRPIVVSIPEFLKQGNAVQDFLKPERVIIGTDNLAAQKHLAFLHRPFMMKRDRIIYMRRRSAELVKYACNAFLATKISFINEMASLAELWKCDIREIREGMITDSRIGDQFLFPGIGYGGSCFPKDVHSLIAQSKSTGFNLQIASAVDAVNDHQRQWPFEKLKKYFGGSLKGKTICLWGLAFKPNTDDLREAPSITLIEKLLEVGARIQAYDPVANHRAKDLFENAIGSKHLTLSESPYEAAKGADALVIVTEWQEFRTPNFKRLTSLLKTHIIIDGRNIYDQKIIEKHGFKYFAVGVG